MVNIFLISGSYKKQYFEEDFIKELKSEIKDNNVLCFIPTNFNEISRNKQRCQKIVQWFNQKRIIFKKVRIIDYSIDRNQALEYLKESNIIFLYGGDTLKQIEGINKLKIKDSIIKYSKNVIGMSAGAINLAKKVVLTKDVEDNIPETTIYEGLGLTSINIEPHCDFQNEEHWEDLLKSSQICKIYCMEDNCSIIVKNNKIKILGNYCIIENGVITFENRS